MNDIALLEDALRAYLNRRCRRAYAHDLRNGLQGIFGGVDALTRAARSPKPVAIPMEQVTQFIQQAITNHERGLERVLESMAPEKLDVVPVSLRELLSDLMRFLTNDAARNNVRIRMDLTENLVVHAVFARLQLIALALLTEAIDAMPAGGEIRISGQMIEGRAQVAIVDSRTEQRPASFVTDILQQLVSQLSGRVESKPMAPTGHEARIELPCS